MDYIYFQAEMVSPGGGGEESKPIWFFCQGGCEGRQIIIFSNYNPRPENFFFKWECKAGRGGWSKPIKKNQAGWAHGGF